MLEESVIEPFNTKWEKICKKTNWRKNPELKMLKLRFPKPAFALLRKLGKV